MSCRCQCNLLTWDSASDLGIRGRMIIVPCLEKCCCFSPAFLPSFSKIRTPSGIICREKWVAPMGSMTSWLLNRFGSYFLHKKSLSKVYMLMYLFFSYLFWCLIFFHLSYLLVCGLFNMKLDEQ